MCAVDGPHRGADDPAGLDPALVQGLDDPVLVRPSAPPPCSTATVCQSRIHADLPAATMRRVPMGSNRAPRFLHPAGSGRIAPPARYRRTHPLQQFDPFARIARRSCGSHRRDWPAARRARRTRIAREIRNSKLVIFDQCDAQGVASAGSVVRREPATSVSTMSCTRFKGRKKWPVIRSVQPDGDAQFGGPR